MIAGSYSWEAVDSQSRGSADRRYSCLVRSMALALWVTDLIAGAAHNPNILHRQTEKHSLD